MLQIVSVRMYMGKKKKKKKRIGCVFSQKNSVSPYCDAIVEIGKVISEKVIGKVWHFLKKFPKVKVGEHCCHWQ